MIEIFGIDKLVFRCAGCELIMRLLDEDNQPYLFYSVISYLDCDNIAVKDYQSIDKLRLLCKANSMHVPKSYPVVFIDGIYIKNRELIESLQ